MPDAPPAGSGVALACVRAAVRRVLEIDDEVAPDTRLADLGADSLAIVEIADLMEDEMVRHTGVPVSVDDIRLTRVAGDGGAEHGR